MAVYTASPVSLDVHFFASFLSMTIIRSRPPKPILSLRAVERADLSSLTRINVDAGPHDPQWDYRYPKRGQYPEEHRRYVHLAIEDYLSRCDSGVTQCMVVSSGFDGASGKKTKVIAFSVWDVAGAEPDKSKEIEGPLIQASRPATSPGSKNVNRADGNPVHIDEYAKATTKAYQELVYARYGARNRQLRRLSTDPAHWRQGAASMLLKWGIEEATRQNVAITTFASPMGKRLYEKFGFFELGQVNVQVDGEEECVNVSCMAWEPRNFTNAQSSDL